MYNPKYFTLYELLHSYTALQNGIENIPEDFDIIENLANLCQWLDKFREKSGKAIKINSGYRCRPLNQRISRSANNSWHLYGKAADIRFSNGPILDLWKLVGSIVGFDPFKFEFFENDQFETYVNEKKGFVHFAIKK